MKILKIVIIVLIVAALALAALFFFGGGTVADKLEKFGDSAMADADIQKAQRFYSLALKLDGDDVTAREALAESYAASGDYTAAEAFLNESIARQPEAGAYYLALCRVYTAQDKLLDAVALLDEAEKGPAAEAVALSRPEAPTFYPESGSYTYNISVTIFCPSNSACYYSDGEDYPSLYGSVFIDPVDVAQQETRLSALAVSGDGIVSRLATADYTVENVIATVELKDAALNAAARAALGKGAEDVLWTDELWSIRELTVSAGGETGLTLYSLDELSYFKGLESLTISGCEGIGLAPVGQMTGLTSLTVTNCAVTAQGLKDLTGLENLEYLNLSSNRIAGVSAIGELKKLKRLSLNGNSLASVEGLEGARALEALDIGGNAVEDLTPLGKLPALRELYGENLLISDLTPLSGLKTLEKLELPGCKVEDVSPLAECPALKRLVLRDNAVADASPLAACSALEHLDLARNALTSISGLEGLSALEHLDISGNAVASLPGDMSGMTALKWAYMSNNTFTGVSPLAGCGNLTYINIEYCPVSSLAPLTALSKLETVMAFGTRIADRGGLEQQGVLVYWDLNLS